MYVCICNGYRDRDIAQAARHGHRDAPAAYEALGCGPQCGQCLTYAQAILDEAHGEAQPAMMLAVQTA